MNVIRKINKAKLKKYIGRYIQVKQRDGSVVVGKLVAIDNGRAYIKPVTKKKGKPVTSNWIIGLFLVGIVFVGLFAFWGAAWGSGWGGGRGCFKRCCGIPCHQRCGCHHGGHHRYGRKRRAIYA